MVVGMRIDVHAHLWNEAFLGEMEVLGLDGSDQRRSGATDSDEDLAVRFALMDRGGVDVQVLSTSPLQPYGGDPSQCDRVARFANDWYASPVAQHPGRFMAFASIPLPHVDGCVREIRRALDELGLAGVALTTSVLGRRLGDAGFDEVFAELDRRAAVVSLHPSGSGLCSPPIEERRRWIIGAPLEDTLNAAQLILDGLPLRYPNIRFINAHLAGGLAMLLGRLDDQYRWVGPDLTERPSTLARRMWYDTVSHADPAALRTAVAVFGADRLLFGTDYPYVAGQPFIAAISHVGDIGLDDEDRSGVLGKTAADLLDIASANLSSSPPGATAANAGAPH
jgi:aminocarboxymuconate-semialdehyde decarboxylase